MAGAFLVVRIKGQADVPHWAVRTMELLKLDKKYRATILPARDSTAGMLQKVQHYVSWTEVDAGLAGELVEKRARKRGHRRLTKEDMGRLGFAGPAEMGSALAEGSATLSKMDPLLPWFSLSPPRSGFKRSTKRLYGQRGVLGRNAELGDIVRRMI
ncbi:MAG: 50S ribosomal protein L30 [Nitrosopumilus sp.]|nr:50S ribosomal protein L30 [Nitrosopumilus sp.]MDA7999220.1 50S ribosomal protein L30 [Nitrosopumilus sp.]